MLNIILLIAKGGAVLSIKIGNERHDSEELLSGQSADTGQLRGAERLAENGNYVFLRRYK